MHIDTDVACSSNQGLWGRICRRLPYLLNWIEETLFSRRPQEFHNIIWKFFRIADGSGILCQNMTNFRSDQWKEKIQIHYEHNSMTEEMSQRQRVRPPSLSVAMNKGQFYLNCRIYKDCLGKWSNKTDEDEKEVPALLFTLLFKSSKETFLCSLEMWSSRQQPAPELKRCLLAQPHGKYFL